MTDVNGAIADIQKNFGLILLCMLCINTMNILYCKKPISNKFIKKDLDKLIEKNKSEVCLYVHRLHVMH
jgi:hypothetical protein